MQSEPLFFSNFMLKSEHFCDTINLIYYVQEVVFVIMDLHNHTVFSYDGSNTPEEIIEHAILHGFDAVGICDHQFTIKNRLGEYIDYITRCKEKYKKDIKVLVGLEVSMNPAPEDFMTQSTEGLDYILFERLDKFNATDLYDFLELRREFNCPVGLAHCDVFAMSEKYGVDMLEIMRRENIFWELNTSGNYNYYYDFLTNENKRNAVKRSGVGVAVGSDTHAIFEYRKKQIINANKLIREMALPLPFAMR